MSNTFESPGVGRLLERPTASSTEGLLSSSMSHTGLSSVCEGRTPCGTEGGLRGGRFLEAVLWDCESDNKLVAWLRKGLSNAFLMFFTLM